MVPGTVPVVEAEAVQVLATSQLDEATDTALLLARAVGSAVTFAACSSEDGTTVRLPGAGTGHIRLLVDQPAQVRSVWGEANHLRAAARLKVLQPHCNLAVWIMEAAERAGRPEIAAAVAESDRHHLTIVLLLERPELAALATPSGRPACGHAGRV